MSSPALKTDPGELQERLAPLLAAVNDLAQTYQHQPEALLDILRCLESLHRAIQDGPFRGSLPEDRNKLYSLLQAMERRGGWPYIPRLQLKTFIDLLDQDPAGLAA